MRQLYAQTSMRLVTQNVRGLTNEKLEMIIHTMKDRWIHAAALQETWAAEPSGRDNEVIGGFLIIWHGETVRSCTRGRLGVVIILSPVARLAWEAGGELVRRDRDRAPLRRSDQLYAPVNLPRVDDPLQPL